MIEINLKGAFLKGEVELAKPEISEHDLDYFRDLGCLTFEYNSSRNVIKFLYLPHKTLNFYPIKRIGGRIPSHISDTSLQVEEWIITKLEDCKAASEELIKYGMTRINLDYLSVEYYNYRKLPLRQEERFGHI